MNLADLENKNNIANNDPWYIVEEGFVRPREREIEAILSIGNGYVGTRNSLEELYKDPTCNPGTFVAGIYEKDSENDYDVLAKMPDWTRIQIFVEDKMLNLFDNKILDHKRYLDLRKGLYVREWRSQDSFGRITNIKITKFISLNNKYEMGKSLIIHPENYSGKIRVRSGIDGNTCDTSPLIQKDDNLLITINTTDKQVSMSQKSKFLNNDTNSQENFIYQTGIQENFIYEEWDWQADVGKTYTINSICLIYSSLEKENPVNATKEHLKSLNNDFYNCILDRHINYLENFWNTAQITIQNDAKAQKLVNFAIFHLISAGRFSGNYTSVPARDLSGEAYKGHIFWDTEIYLLPFFSFIMPDIARNLLLYRYNTLTGAKKNAANEGFNGASYAWESTYTGINMTPKQAMQPNGKIIPIYSGKYERHIGPDIVYAIKQYWIKTEDIDFICDYGAEMIFEIARFCKNLMIRDDDGLYHINNVIGPDEYHEMVDDNTYTNLMVQYSFKSAIEIFDHLNSSCKDKLKIIKDKIDLTDNEISDWKEIQNSIYVSFDSKTKIYEEFKGYFDCEYIDVRSYEPRTGPMDLLLGWDEIRKTQVVKQADTVLAMFLLANDFSRDTIEDNFDYYEPRTSHGSSLSPSIYSIVAARLNKKDTAFNLFKQNALIDLSNNMGNAAGGIHIASAGGTWMSITMGFAGIYVFAEGLLLDPHIPDHWQKLEFSFLWKNQKISLQITHKQLSLNIFGNDKVKISLGPANWKELEPNKKYLADKSLQWQWR